jgi:hypothetical protein
MGRLKKIGGIALVVLLVAMTALAPPVSGQARFRSIVLDEGALSGYRWGMVAHRDRGREGGRRPCITVIVYFGSGWESDDTVCGSLPRGGPPEIRSYSFGEGEDQVTIFALAFENRISSVSLDLGEGGEKLVHLHTLNERQRKIAGLRPFRFRTFAVRGPFCLGEVSGYDATGAAIYHAPPEECSA